MANVGAGAQTLLHWWRTRRAVNHAATPVDRSAVRSSLARIRPDLNLLAEQAGRDGVVAVPSYWAAEQCAEARAAIDRIISQYPDAVQNHSGGADKRMFGVESVSSLLMAFHADPFLRQFGELLSGLDIYNFATLGARIEATETNAGSGDGWHRDAHGFQYKAILYLCDTDIENGPFEYLVGSHTTMRAATDAMMAGIADAQSTRLSDAEVDRIAARGIQRRVFAAEAGTLLLVNTAGIHRGMPLKARVRYALTNYYYHRIEIDEERIRKFSPLVPGTAERIRQDLLAPA
ncbi:MAG TPA: phytanoyl-CoA dioxygenase family protein [Rhizomicrobium sp.]|jgi:hypothetical protein